MRFTLLFPLIVFAQINNDPETIEVKSGSNYGSTEYNYGKYERININEKRVIQLQEKVLKLEKELKLLKDKIIKLESKDINAK